MPDLTSRSLARDRYRLVAPVGAGGAGAVYRAHDRNLGRTVAIKLLRPGHDEAARARLRAEARIAASVSHPNVAPVLDYGEEMIGDELTPYLVMQYVEGVTLRDVLRGGALPPARVADLVAQIAEALAAAHAVGVVHRDVKPSNIMLSAGGRAVLVDFGVARQAGSDPLTVTGTIVGTVDYMSPEQAAGERATPRSDLYALGMVAHEALTGARALTRETQVATLLAHATEDVAPLPVTVPPGLRALVGQLVRRDPIQRPPDAASVARRALAAASGDHPCAEEPATVTERPHSARRSQVGGLAVGVAALLLGVLAAVLTRGNAVEPGQAAASAGAPQRVMHGATLTPTATPPTRQRTGPATASPTRGTADEARGPAPSTAIRAAETVRRAASSRHRPPGRQHRAAYLPVVYATAQHVDGPRGVGQAPPWARSRASLRPGPGTAHSGRDVDRSD